MSKVDLLHNEDFYEYQKDIESRLARHVRELVILINSGIGTTGAENDLLMRINSKRAIIAELEIILNLPGLYTKKEDEKKAFQKKKEAVFLDVFRSMFGTEST